MTYATHDRERVLAIQPTTRGFGFAVFEGPQEPIDWGVKEVRKNKNAAPENSLVPDFVTTLTKPPDERPNSADAPTGTT